MSTNHTKAAEELWEAECAAVGSPLNINHLARAQVFATLALVDAQAEATAWGKQQLVEARQQQTDFQEDIKRVLAEEH